MDRGKKEEKDRKKKLKQERREIRKIKKTYFPKKVKKAKDYGKLES